MLIRVMCVERICMSSPSGYGPSLFIILWIQLFCSLILDHLGIVSLVLYGKLAPKPILLKIRTWVMEAYSDCFFFRCSKFQYIHQKEGMQQVHQFKRCQQMFLDPFVNE